MNKEIASQCWKLFQKDFQHIFSVKETYIYGLIVNNHHIPKSYTTNFIYFLLIKRLSNFVSVNLFLMTNQQFIK